jgi:Mg/Co/Ni transporter MgtE
VSRRLWHRTPWLLIGLAGAFVAASIVSGFESSLAALFFAARDVALVWHSRCPPRRRSRR